MGWVILCLLPATVERARRTSFLDNGIRLEFLSPWAFLVECCW